MGFFPRLAAYVVDVVTTWVITFALAGIVAALAGDAAQQAFVTTVAVVALPIVIAYYTILHAHRRRTVGKAMVGAVVVRRDLSPIGYGRSFGRLAAEALSSLPLYLGYLWVLWDRDRQGFHDMLADTLVVRRADLPAADD